MPGAAPAIDPALVDFARLGHWMDDHQLPGHEIGDIRVISGGTQNVLLRFTRGDREFVLRRPPRHKRANSDEAMRREAQVLAALEATDVPHPRLIAACPTTDVIGAAFYLMDPVDGFNPSLGLPEPCLGDLAWQRALGESMIDGIVALAEVDPARVAFHEPDKAAGWLERQVPRWRAQLDSYRQLDGYDETALPSVDAIGTWLSVHPPDSWTPGLIHGDFHLANVLARAHGAPLAAIVDWELAAIGDPLLDLGHLLATWPNPGSSPASTPISAPGLPTRGQLIERYAAGSKRDLGNIAWYRALACYRLAILLEGTYARSRAGKAPTDVGERLHEIAVALIDQAHEVIEGNEDE